jgi:hypothetical protein
MRGILMAFSGVLLAGPVLASALLGEVTGNWAGASGQGFDFRAELTEEAGAARLRIWQGMGGMLESEPQLDMTGVVYRDSIIAGGVQTLELASTGTATELLIVTEGTDEMGEVREVVRVAFLDNQFTVVGYSIALTGSPDGHDYDCTVDLVNDSVTAMGETRALEARAFEDDNLSGWGPGAAFSRGFCPSPEAG